MRRKRPRIFNQLIIKDAWTVFSLSFSLSLTRARFLTHTRHVNEVVVAAMNSGVDPQYQFGYLLFNAIVSQRVKGDNESARLYAAAYVCVCVCVDAWMCKGAREDGRSRWRIVPGMKGTDGKRGKTGQ